MKQRELGGRWGRRLDHSPALISRVVAAMGLIVLLAGGCARTPEGASGRVNRQLLVQMTVRGGINLQRHYFVAIDTSDQTTPGPLPVVSEPWGNGWGAGRIDYYVQVDAAQPGFYGLYRFEPDSNLLTPTYLGRPLSASSPVGTSSILFSLDLDALIAPDGSAPAQINLNFIATDLIPIDPNYRGSKLVDALGRAGNNFVTLNTRQTRIYRNADSTAPETSGDVEDPDIDLIDWQVEVRGS